jgi:hypothetical protein
LEAVAVGDLTPAEASELGKLIEAYIKALEATEFAERLAKLERRRAIVRVPRKALPKNGEFGHMCVPPNGDDCALGLDASEHVLRNLAPAV